MKWKETSVSHLIPSLTEQGELKKGVPDCSEHLRGWTLHNLPGKLVPLFNHPYCTIDFTFKPNFFQSMSLQSMCLQSFHWTLLWRSWLSIFFTPLPSRVWGIPEPSLLKTGKSQPSQPLLVPQISTNIPNFSPAFQPFSGLTHTHLSCITISVLSGRCGLTTVEQRGNTCPYHHLSNKFILHKSQQPASSWTVGTHFLPSATPLAGRWQTSNSCDHFPCGGYRHFTELRQNKEYLFTLFTWLVCAHPAMLTWHELNSLADQQRQ